MRHAATFGIGSCSRSRRPRQRSPLSAYTEFDSDRCAHKKGEASENYGTWTCPGYGGFKVILSAGDQRMSVAYADGADRSEWQSFPAANDVYKGKVEWRLRGASFATILRWNVADAGRHRQRFGADKTLRPRVVVSRLGGPARKLPRRLRRRRANANANELARQIAEETRKFTCGLDKAATRGAVTPGWRFRSDAEAKKRETAKSENRSAGLDKRRFLFLLCST